MIVDPPRQESDPATARNARVLVAITFHFVLARFGFLVEVLRSLSEYRIAALHVIVVTNTFDPDELTPLRRLCEEVLPSGLCEIRSQGNLRDPFDLAWSHKAIIAQDFIGQDEGRYSHFIYLEDDIRLGFENFRYFLEYREKLRPFGLLPAFVRVEYSRSRHGLVVSDAFWPVYIPAQSYVLLDDLIFVNMPNPYNPCFILDRELAAEYARSAAFTRDTSASLCPWGIRERAAMGLCLENVPTRYQTRYVVPVSSRTGMAATAARITHLPNNYADDPRSPLGELRLDELFAGAADAARISRRDSEEHPEINGTRGFGRELNPNVATGDLYHLITDHDTVLFLDKSRGRIAHAPMGIAPWNLLLELPRPPDSLGRLLIVDDARPEMSQASFAMKEDEMTVKPGIGNADCEIQHFIGGTVAIRGNNLHLGADLDGVARLNRQHCRQWERFRLIRADAIRALTLLRRYTWLSHGDRRLVSLEPQPVHFEREWPSEASALAATLAPASLAARQRLIFGPTRIPLIGRDRIVSVAPDSREGRFPPCQIEINDGAVHVFSRYSPMVHYDLEETDADYRHLRLSLRSLIECGHYRGPIRIRCDRPRQHILEFVPPASQSRLSVSAARRGGDGGAVLDDGIGTLYRPVLLCGPDARFRTAVEPVLIDILLAGGTARMSHQMS